MGEKIEKGSVKKCPFRKTISYEARGNTGNGYPGHWLAIENFQECIGEQCNAYGVGLYGEFCGLCESPA